jgi:hypothetical protein
MEIHTIKFFGWYKSSKSYERNQHFEKLDVKAHELLGTEKEQQFQMCTANLCDQNL